MPNELEDRLLRFGGGATESTLTVASVVLLVAAVLLFFLLKRKYLVITLLFVSTFIPNGQVIVLGGLHFCSSRILLPFAWLSIQPFTYFKKHRFQWNSVDKYLVFYAFAATLSGVLLWQEWGVLVNRLGLLYNLFGTYFLLRLVLTDREDVTRTIRTLAVLSAVLAVFMLWEQGSGRNLFSVFGGVPEVTEVREGKLRSQAPFAHAIVAGTVGATLVPLFVGLWCQGKRSRTLAGLGVLAGIVMTLASFSATPLLALVAGIVGLGLWPLRHQLRWIRWGSVLVLVGLHLVMKAPVWALIQRINVVGGSSGWHRFELIDQAIEHFGEWWLIGVKHPSRWGYFMGDLSNAYVSEAVKGGLFTLLGFIAVLWCGFRRLGVARRAAATRGDRNLELLLWGFGAALFSNAVAFIGIWYFDQSSIIWYALLAMICAITRVPARVGSVASSALITNPHAAIYVPSREPEAIASVPQTTSSTS